MTSVTFLQQTAASQLRPSAPANVTIARVSPAEPEFNARMYREIGTDWNWGDRLSWSDDRWATYCADPCISTLRATVDGDVVGFAELRTNVGAALKVGAALDADAAANVDVDMELVYFGILPEFTGRGLGGWFLSEVCRIAWMVPGCRRVWLHTCDDDSPAAIPNYLARGFEVYARSDSGCAACSD
ncbi:N-acetyltransferase [Dietzia sp. NCCP-2495]|uniref:GNAT family N-acetyltransferase n=1 Tax=Dietzia sp. NCCP-2495 TaxID=2934675 RepID=UPI002230B419|nr:GNAT family N-acetyltransferase [Dietzia sp. NCCP-2495]GLB63401.1 N-acetyltransferase [Dietzia sp. NCCP-2495]